MAVAPRDEPGTDGAASVDDAVAVLKRRVDAIEGTVGHLEPLVVRIDERLRSTLPHLATKAEVQTLQTQVETLLPSLVTKTEFLTFRHGLDVTLPQLATKAEVEALKTGVDAAASRIASKDDLQAFRIETEERFASLDAKMGGRDARVERFGAELTQLNAKVDKLDTRMDGLDVKMATLETTIAGKPDRGFIIGTVLTMFGLYVASAAATMAALQFLQIPPPG